MRIIWPNRGCKHGYTIIESMLFLVITATLLISALAVFQGRHNRTEFTQAVRETEARLKTIINEVGSGQFPGLENVRCSYDPETGRVDVSEGEQPQGTSQDCIFLGKVLQFGVRDESGNCDAAGETSRSLDNVRGCDTYRVFTVAGARQVAAGQIPSDLSEAAPTAIPQLTRDYKIPGGLFVSRVLLMSSRTQADDNNCQSNTPYPGCDIGSVAYYQSLGSSSPGGGDIVSGSQSPETYPISDSQLGQGDQDIIDFIQEFPDHYQAEKNPIEGVVVCLSDGSRHAAITMGARSRVFSTNIIIDNVPGACQWF